MTRHDPFAYRRNELMRRLGPRAVALVEGARLARRNGDVDHRFHQSSDLFYLTGFDEPDAFAVLRPASPTPFVLFLRPRDVEREAWTGRRLGVEGARASLAADAAYPIETLERELPALLDGADEVHYAIGQSLDVDRRVVQAVAGLREGQRRGKRAPSRLVDLKLTLHEMRLQKDEQELEQLRRAVTITEEAHLACMRATRPGVAEYALEALVDYTFRRRGAWGPGYGTIVAAGANATVMHYVDCRDHLLEGQLVLVDAGAEVGGLTADVTRTFPVSGRFTPAQRRAYDAVLRVQEGAINMVAPGRTIDAVHQLTVERLTAAMIELGLLAGDVGQLVETQAYRRFYLHRTSHWLGMDVHDVGAYYQDGAARPLAPGMVLTIEPGLYVPDAPDVPSELRGVGIRIEDDVLVTAEGCEVLTAGVPKQADELERIVGAD